MAASQNDFFAKVAAPTATTLSAPGHTIGGTTFNVGSNTGWPTDTGVFFAVDTVQIVNGQQVRDNGSLSVWEGVVSGPTTVSNAVLRFGSDQNYPAGSTTRVYISVHAAQMNRLIDGLLVSLDQDGTLKTGAVDNTNVLAANVVTTAKILDANVTTSKIADANVTSAKLAQNFVKGKSQISGTNTDFSNYLIQMGTQATANFAGGGDLNTTITFPTAFSSPPIVTASPMHNQGAIDQVYSSIVGITTTTAVLRAHVTVVGTPNPVTFNWIAIGAA